MTRIQGFGQDRDVRTRSLHDSRRGDVRREEKRKDGLKWWDFYYIEFRMLSQRQVWVYLSSSFVSSLQRFKEAHTRATMPCTDDEHHADRPLQKGFEKIKKRGRTKTQERDPSRILPLRRQYHCCSPHRIIQEAVVQIDALPRGSKGNRSASAPAPTVRAPAMYTGTAVLMSA